MAYNDSKLHQHTEAKKAVKIKEIEIKDEIEPDDDEDKNKIQLGPIIGVSFLNTKTGDELPVNNLKDPIKFKLLLGSKSLGPHKNIDPRKAYCAYWHKSKKSWSSKNCVKKGTEFNETSFMFTIICECDHLTDFGVIFDPDGRETPRWMGRLSDWAVGLSLGGTVVTILLHTTVPHLHQRAPQKLFIGEVFGGFFLF